jgi:hypothetical protein
MVACVGLRQAAQVLQVARRTIERRFLWLGRHAAEWHANRLADAIDRKSLFIVATEVGALRRKGRLTALQRRRRADHERRHGRRPSQSTTAVRAVLVRLSKMVEPRREVVLDSDHKPLYGKLGHAVFPGRFRWRQHSATARRDRANPLFPINHTNARLRHFLARLRRRTWCVTKRRDGLRA